MPLRAYGTTTFQVALPPWSNPATAPLPSVRTGTDRSTSRDTEIMKGTIISESTTPAENKLTP